jgi:hypothetical protein
MYIQFQGNRAGSPSLIIVNSSAQLSYSTKSFKKALVVCLWIRWSPASSGLETVGVDCSRTGTGTGIQSLRGDLVPRRQLVLIKEALVPIGTTCTSHWTDPATDMPVREGPRYRDLR